MKVRVLSCCALLLAGAATAEVKKPSDHGLMVLPVRWCVLEGSREAQNIPAGGFVPTYRADSSALMQANEVWLDAGLYFFSQVMTDPLGNKGVPVIADPFEGMADEEDLFLASQVASECTEIWNQRAEGKEGMVLVTARGFVDLESEQEAQPNTGFTLWVDGANPADDGSEDGACSPGLSIKRNEGWAIVAEPAFEGDDRPEARIVTQELGHILFLDQAEVAPLTLFPKRGRYDVQCDQLATAGEVKPVEVLLEAERIEIQSAAPEVALTDHQIEKARKAAARLPGCLGADCADADQLVLVVE